MTRKFYTITTLIEGTPTAISSKAVTSPSADSGATGSQIDDIRNSGVQVFAHTTPGIWLRRASARSAAAYLNGTVGHDYSVKEIGEFKRTVRPVRHYEVQINFGSNWSVLDRGGVHPTRAAARSRLADAKREDDKNYPGWHKDSYGGWKYRIVTVYADA